MVGAGPVGLTLANELFRHGVPCQVIDSGPEATVKTKALGIMPRTLELLARLGLADIALSRGFVASAFHPFSNARPIARVEFQRVLPEAPYPCPVMLPQHETEGLLTDHLVAQGGVITWATELVRFAQHDEYVDVVLRDGDGQEEQVRVEWLVGCDGAHSAVRHLLDLDFEGNTMEQRFAVGNVLMKWNMPPDEMLVFVRKGSFIALFPMLDGRHRVIVGYDLDRAPSGEVTLEEIQRMIDVSGVPGGARVEAPTELGRFRVNQRKAVGYRRGRVFLAGDAAHIHSPVGAQGMNTGMQDAFNLAWKLSLVVQGKAPPRLLESYEVEREQVGTALLKGTNIATRIALTRNPLLAGLRTRVAPLVLSRDVVQRRVARIVTEISLSYKQSEWIVDDRASKGTVKAGNRAPDGPIRFRGKGKQGTLFEVFATIRPLVLLFAGSQPATLVKQRWQEIQTLIAAGYADTVERYLVTRDNAPEYLLGDQVLEDYTGTIHQRYDSPRGSLLLVRPDGYIGFRGQFGATEPLHTYIKRLLMHAQSLE